MQTENLTLISKKYTELSAFKKIVASFELSKQTNKIYVTGLLGSSTAILLSEIYKKLNKTLVIVISDFEEAAYFYSDMSNLLPAEEVLMYPSSYKRTFIYGNIDNSSVLVRSEVLSKLLDETKKYFIVTHAEAIQEKVVVKNVFESNILNLSKGESTSVGFIIDLLNEYGFERTDFVYEPGQYSNRGSIIDVFSFSNEFPYRIDFFGDDVDSIRTFNPETQISIKQHDKISIIPDIKTKLNTEVHESFFKYLPSDSLVIAKDINYTIEKINYLIDTARKKEIELEEEINFSHIETDKDILENLQNFQLIELGNKKFFNESLEISFDTTLQPAFKKNFDLLSENLFANQTAGYKNCIVSESPNQFERLRSIFSSINSEVKFIPVLSNIHQGFIDHDLKICCFTDHEIFERYHKYKTRTSFSKKDSLSIKELTDLHQGDYVVHIDHGIGIFGGLQKISLQGKEQEAIRLVYKDNDILFVSIHSLHRISKFKGKDSDEPTIHKLGSGAWQKLKQNAKKKIKDIAKDLIVLYAQRKQKEGFQFSPDTYMQEELEASFIYEDTPDQIKSTAAVKLDMESAIPMDRLVCGDVGFGKTEIAIRAAFKAVADNKQVAILVPTTILALQHYNTFADRLRQFPCKVDYISRFKKASEQKEVLKNVKEGKIDILIGTHRILGKDLEFKDLGLFIIDEEQKFGVAAKEKLRQIKVDVDTLTLTATPIPRTLQFSLMGARDLSVINTPPPNRHPIVTELHTFNEEIIKEAIQFEVNRGGQVFFINNRVQNIEDIAMLVRKLCPTLRVIIAHGQMDGDKLEKVMLDFIDGAFDVLVATSIIESGLDIPNANTIIINNAHHFGLSDLHQLRGRVGRSNKKAFCYLLAPPTNIISTEAKRRLRAIEEYSDLGSGFNIALQDLDIRGAGNLLGGEQSGFIADIGIETYQRILDEAIQELKDNEFRGVFEAEETEKSKDDKVYVKECNIETDFEILLPDEYISNISERINLYRELDNIKDEVELQRFEQNMTDRFGELPKQAIDLLNVVRLRWLALKIGFEKLVIKNEQMVAYFISNQESTYYQSPTFSGVLNYLQKNQHKCKMKETKEKLMFLFSDVKNIDIANRKIAEIVKFIFEGVR